LQELSYKPKRIMEFIYGFWDSKGYPPTIRDIAHGCSISSTSVVKYNLDILEKKGYIRCHSDIARGIELIERSAYNKHEYRIPVIGQIAAGKPIPVPELDNWNNWSYQETIMVTTDLTRGRHAIYALKVKGWSMVDALVSDGDIVLMEYVNTVENGEVAAIWLKEEREATLKKFYAENGRIRLQPANNKMKPIYVKPENIEVQGRVITVIRQFGAGKY